MKRDITVDWTHATHHDKPLHRRSANASPVNGNITRGLQIEDSECSLDSLDNHKIDIRV